MNNIHHLADKMPANALHGRIGAILAQMQPDALEALIDAAIATLDAMAGDADLEPNGDELDGTFLEDEGAACFAILGEGAGCLFSDNDAEHDGREPECGDDMPAPVYGIDQSAPLPRYGLSPLFDPAPHFECGGI